MAKSGRRKGGRNNGYWFDSRGGWSLTKGIKLCDPERNHSKDPRAEEDAKLAYMRWEVEKQGGRENPGRQVQTIGQITVVEACETSLDHAEKHGCKSTCEMRSRFLFDLCTGYPPRFRGYTGGPDPRERIHPGCVLKPVSKLTKLDIENGTDAHQD